MKSDIEYRMKELAGSVDEDSDEEEVSLSVEELKTKINDIKHLASREDVAILELTSFQKAKIEDDIGSVYVRCDPGSMYNKDSSELYKSKKEQEIRQKLARIKNCYYNEADWRAAMNIISEAFQYSLDNDYPWMSEEERIEAVKSGEIRWLACNIPNLYINWTQKVTGKIAQGVLDGSITIEKKSNPFKPSGNKKKKKSVETIPVDVNLMSKETEDVFTKLHASGYKTILSSAIKAKSNIFNRYNMPKSLFGNETNEPELSLVEQLLNGRKIDWFADNTALFKDILEPAETPESFMNKINEANGGNMSKDFKDSYINFIESSKYYHPTATGFIVDKTPENYICSSLHKDSKASELEQNVLNAILASN